MNAIPVAIAVSLVTLVAPDRAIPLTKVAIGMEGRVLYRYSGGTLRAKVATDKAPVVARIVSSVPDGNATLYDVRFIPQFSGRPDLRDALERIDGASLDDAPAAIVEVTSALPLDHNGLLTFASRFKLPSLGGYRLALIGFGVLWAIPVAIFIAKRFRNRPAPVALQVLPPPVTLADQLRPLIISAIEGKATIEQKAFLERLLIAFWREKLALGSLSAAAALSSIRGNSEAGELLDAVEDWLHRRHATGVSTERVANLLKPYAAAPAIAAPAEVSA